MRFSVWTAVSTPDQAKSDRVSLEEQLQRCRDAGTSRGWVETAGPYIAPGESRTKYVNLADAERNIPALGEMLDAAKRGEYDILILYDFSRLRDLLAPVEKTLGAYRVQLFSVSQPVEPQPPETYSPHASDASSIMSGMAQILSRAQIADLRRKYDYAMPRRAQRGLPVQVPFGYTRVDRKSPPVIDPVEAAHVLMMRDLLLEGKSLTSIADALNAEGVTAPRGGAWTQQTVKAILKNPFYAGKVRWGATKTHNDPRTGKQRRDRKPPPSQVITAQGQHEPLWDEAMHEHIKEVVRSRGHQYEGKRSNQLSGLLYCGECGARMWVYYRFPRQPFSEITWYCSAAHTQRVTGHPRVPHLRAVELVGEELRREVQDAPLDAPIVPRANGKLADLQARRTRILEAYEAGAMPLADYAPRMAELDDEIKKATSSDADMARLRYEAEKRREALVSLKEDADYIPGWIAEADPKEVNNILRMVIAKIVLREDSAELQFKA